jgi:aspartate-semialdehyde dehydrogenase
VAAPQKKKLCFALVGSETLRGREIRSVLAAASGSGLTSAVSVAGKDKVFVGQIKKAESAPGGFWIWAVADNLTVGSALNAYGIARSLFKIS